MSILVGISVYFYVMIVCLLHESPQESVVASQKQQYRPTDQEEMTTPEKPMEKPKPPRPPAPTLPQRTRTSVPPRTQISLIGREAPDFDLLDLDGRRVKLSYFKGKLVILDFWATWCGPCVREIPHFIELYERYADRGLVVLGVSVDRAGSGVVDSFVERNKVNYQVLMADSQVKGAYGGIRSIPTTFVIDREGKIQRRYIGYMDKAVFEADIKTFLVTDESLLADLDSDESGEQLDAMENLIARGTFPQSEVFLKFCNDIEDPASLEVSMAVRVHTILALYLSHTPLTQEDLTCLKDLPSPLKLEFDRKPITDAAIAYLGGLSSLRTLSLRYSKITDAGLAELNDLTSLHTLRLEGTKITDEGLVNLKDLSSLRVLFVGGSNVTDAGLIHVENLTELVSFCVHHAQITDEGILHLKNLRNLKYLCLHDTEIGDAGLKHLKDLSNLETLNLHNTQITDDGLPFLENLSSLKRLSLAGTRVSRKGVAKLRQVLPGCNISWPRLSK
jgi:peroxiredoxin